MQNQKLVYSVIFVCKFSFAVLSLLQYLNDKICYIIAMNAESNFIDHVRTFWFKLKFYFRLLKKYFLYKNVLSNKIYIIKRLTITIVWWYALIVTKEIISAWWTQFVAKNILRSSFLKPFQVIWGMNVENTIIIRWLFYHSI